MRSKQGDSLGIEQIVGRWAQLCDGDWVTPVPAFFQLGYDVQAFDARIARFQSDPEGEIARNGIAERITRGRKP